MWEQQYAHEHPDDDDDEALRPRRRARRSPYSNPLMDAIDRRGRLFGVVRHASADELREMFVTRECTHDMFTVSGRPHDATGSNITLFEVVMRGFDCDKLRVVAEHAFLTSDDPLQQLGLAPKIFRKIEHDEHSLDVHFPALDTYIHVLAKDRPSVEFTENATRLIGACMIPPSDPETGAAALEAHNFTLWEMAKIHTTEELSSWVVHRGLSGAVAATLPQICFGDLRDCREVRGWLAARKIWAVLAPRKRDLCFLDWLESFVEAEGGGYAPKETADKPGVAQAPAGLRAAYEADF